MRIEMPAMPAAVAAVSPPALEISKLQAWYGESHILHDVDLKVNRGEVVTLLGRNGAGRTTTLRAIMGLTGQRKGSVRINGREVVHLPVHRIAHLGVGYCPEERGIFSSLSCEENLLLPAAAEGRRRGHERRRDLRAVPQPRRARATARARGFRAASSRCWPWRASCAPAPTCCCSTRSRKASRP